VRDFPGGVPKGESPSTDGRTSQADPSGTSREGPVLPKRESAPSGTGLLRGSLTPLGTGREAWYSQRESLDLRNRPGEARLPRGSLRTPPEARTAPPRESLDSQRLGVPKEGPDGPPPRESTRGDSAAGSARGRTLLGKGLFSPTRPDC
jgi:hypothetical protein